ncbi:MAG: helix-turn-helix transcriptional regulator [Oscillospiraceae bacterium]|nr:helix-turn-helix transcriptional regulator [Oscillospiraceae bacterium]
MNLTAKDELNQNIPILPTKLHNLYLLTYYQNNFSPSLSQAPLYIHQFKFYNNRYLPESQDFLINHPDPSVLPTSLKLKWYRCINGYFQRDIADYLHIWRKTYSNYEKENYLIAFPPDKIKLLCKLYNLVPADLLDDYNLFLYYNYHDKILKQYRLDHNYTQAQFANILGIVTHTYAQYERLEVTPTKTIYENIFKNKVTG